MQTQRLYQNAGMLLFLSAALHLLVILFTGGAYLMQMLIAAVLWGILGYLLMGERRWAAYVAFLGMLFGIIAYLGFGMSEFGVVKWLFFAILLADLLAAIMLFRIIWRTKVVQEV
ncbi:MAG: hypothetical protein AAF429_03525 [Pseudomonadota bacterium]